MWYQESSFVGRKENHKIEIYGDPIYDMYEDDVLGTNNEGFIDSGGRRHDDSNTNHPTNLTDTNQFFNEDMGNHEDLAARLHKVQDAILYEIRDEIQKMKLSMAVRFKSLGDTMNRLVEVVRNIGVDGGRAGDGSIQRSLKCSVGNHHNKQNARGDTVHTNLIYQALYMKWELLCFNDGKPISWCSNGKKLCITPFDALFGRTPPPISTVSLSSPRELFADDDTTEYNVSTDIHRTAPKLSYRLYAPFKVEACAGQVVYIRLLPKDSLIHLDFHVSLLTIWVSEYEPVPDKPPPLRDKEFTK